MKKVTKILLLISLALLILSAFSGIVVVNEIGFSPSSDPQYVDGTNFTPLINLFGSLGIVIVGIVVAMPFVGTIAAIWIIYWIILFIKWIVQKVKN